MAAPLWRVDSGRGRVWLFGDQATSRREWMTPQVASAVDTSSVLWVEVPEDDDPVANPRLRELGFSPDSDLADVLGPTRWQRAVSLANSVNVDLSSWRSMRPWLAAQIVDAAFMSISGADAHRPGAVLTARARSNGIKIRSEFTMDEILDFYASLPRRAELAFADTILARVEAGQTGFRAESEAWLAGDSRLCEAYMEDIRSRSGVLADVIGRQRNQEWVARVESALTAGEVHFVLVGFGHLAGPDRIQVHLEASGLEVERVE